MHLSLGKLGNFRAFRRVFYSDKDNKNRRRDRLKVRQETEMKRKGRSSEIYLQHNNPCSVALGNYFPHSGSNVLATACFGRYLCTAPKSLRIAKLAIARVAMIFAISSRIWEWSPRLNQGAN